jgi:DNA-binding MarR family transcriptional regulator
MSKQVLLRQAADVEAILPRLMRQLFTLDVNDPTIELPVGQVRVCSILREGPRTMSAISKELGISLSGTTQIADRLERVGLVERIGGTDDRRVKSLQLTPHGVEVMRRRNERRVRRVAEALGALEPEERIALLDAIQALLRASQAIVENSPGEAIIAETMVS